MTVPVGAEGAGIALLGGVVGEVACAMPYKDRSVAPIETARASDHRRSTDALVPVLRSSWWRFGNFPPLLRKDGAPMVLREGKIKNLNLSASLHCAQQTLGRTV